MAKASPRPPIPPALLLRMYRTMVTIRMFESEVRRMHMAGLAPGLVHLYSGQEAVAVGACAAIRPDDYIASHHRGHGHCIAKGMQLDRLFAEILGRRPGSGLGRGGSMHILDAATGNLGTNGIVGGSIPLATGAALSSRLRGSPQVALSFFGDGVLNQGLMFEAMNMASLWALPVVFVCENNGYGEFTEIDDVTAGRPYTKRGEAFDIPSVRVDGMDVLDVYGKMERAVSRCRDGAGPTFLICDTYRFSGHHVSDKQEYKDAAEQRAWEKLDPIPRLARRLVRSRQASAEGLARIDDEIKTAVRQAADNAKNMPPPGAADLTAHVYA